MDLPKLSGILGLTFKVDIATLFSYSVILMT